MTGLAARDRNSFHKVTGCVLAFRSIYTIITDNRYMIETLRNKFIQYTCDFSSSTQVEDNHTHQDIVVIWLIICSQSIMVGPYTHGLWSCRPFQQLMMFHTLSTKGALKCNKFRSHFRRQKYELLAFHLVIKLKIRQNLFPQYISLNQQRRPCEGRRPYSDNSLQSVIDGAFAITCSQH